LGAENVFNVGLGMNVVGHNLDLVGTLIPTR
jgi:hypothetical protein